jgi:hypothetical protein
MATATKGNETKTEIPSAFKSKVTSTPPEFVRSQGRQKSERRMAITALKAGEWLDLGTPEGDPEKEKNAIRSMTNSVKSDLKVDESVEATFSVREDSKGHIWVGRTK